MRNVIKGPAALVACALTLASPAVAATVTSWNLDNVRLAPNPANPAIGVSNIYDRDVTSGTVGAISRGRIVWLETPAPGMTVLNDDPDLNPGINVPNCMVAVGSNCEGPFQSDKRVKMPVTALGAIDLVFNVDPDGSDRSYQMFHRFSNLTPDKVGRFTLELGYGIGDNFARSVGNDGLLFDLSVQFGPDNEPAFSQFPFGLFGDASTNPNFDLDGFFGPERAGFELLAGTKVIRSGEMASIYANLFGPRMLNQLSVPQGYFWDNDGDPVSDALLMAWWNGSAWEARRQIDPSDPAKAITIAPTIVDTDFLLGQGFYLASVDDLRALNVNYVMRLTDAFSGNQFTLRFTSTAVPEPTTWAMMFAGLGLLGAIARRRKPARPA